MDAARPTSALLASLAVAALLGACVVEIEGAPCALPGGALDCPGGQACGNDLRCSARALACAGSRCTPGTGGECLDPTGVTSGVDGARRCVGDDPVCGTWIVEPCTPGGLTCAVQPAFGARCVCPPTGSRELAVRPDGSPAAAPPFATGATSPAACAFLRLGDALAAAATLTTDPTAVVTVTSGGVAPGATRTFSAAAGETFPLVVADRVTLRSDVGGGASEIVFDVENGPTAPVVLHAGGALAGFTVRNGAGDQDHSAIDLRCDGRATPARLSAVTLDGRGAGSARLGHGILATSTCGLVAQDVVVRDMSIAAVVVDAAGLPTVAFTGGSITGSGDGIVIGNGRLVLDATHVTSNSGTGVRGDSFTGSPRVTIRGSKVVGNGDTGIALVNAAELRITSTTIYGNGAITSWGGAPPYRISRKAGGLVLWGNPPASGSLEFASNRIYGNRGDQVLVLETSSTWNLDGPADCGSFNSLGCYDPTPSGTTTPYSGLVSIDASVSARYTAWDDYTPSSADYASLGVDVGGIDPGTFFPVAQYCADTTRTCGSEDPLPP